MEDLSDNLRRYVEMIERAWWERLKSREPSPTLYEPIKDILGRGGKRLRPCLCMLSCEFVGGDAADALPTALGIELFHNFSLVHDDIEDGSRLRRGQPTLHIKYGLPVAVNAGDALFALCFDVLCENERLLGVERAWRIFREIAALSVTLAEGQALDILFKQTMRMSVEDVIEILHKKTARLFAVSAKCGAIAGGAPDDITSKLGNAWEHIGIAFQIRDDVLNLKGSEEEYGKRIGEDIYEGKPTLIIVHCLARCNASERREIMKCLGNYDKEAIENAIRIFEKHHSIEYAEKCAEKYLQEGLKILNKTEGNAEMRQNMIALAEFFVERMK